MTLKDRVSAFLGKDNKTDESAVNEKSDSGFSPYVSQYLFGDTLSLGWISPNIAMLMWELSDVVYDTIDLIASPFSQMTYSLYDKKTKEYITGAEEHPFLALLESPGYFKDSTRLMYELMVSFLVANAAYPKLVGNVGYEPTEMTCIYANKANLIQDGNNRLLNITFSDNEDGNTYERQLIPKRKTAVYQAENKLAEVIQITKALRRYGVYPSSPMSRIIQQAYTKYYGVRHNSGLLKNGSRPGGLWSSDSKDGMTQQQYEWFKTEVSEKFSGPNNAGRNIVAPGPVKYENFLLNPRDMDFIGLIEKSSEDIYNLYHIPLALRATKNMTLNNFEKSQIALYDQAVLPNAYMVLKRLGEFALPRYKDGDRFELTFDEKTLPALRSRMMETAKTMREVGSYTEDEIRGATGHEAIEGGEVIWKPSTLVPAEDIDEMGEPPEEVDEDEIDE